eukprot:3931880-Rhodomonas_salina.2
MWIVRSVADAALALNLPHPSALRTPKALRKSSGCRRPMCEVSGAKHTRFAGAGAGASVWSEQTPQANSGGRRMEQRLAATVALVRRRRALVRASWPR